VRRAHITTNYLVLIATCQAIIRAFPENRRAQRVPQAVVDEMPVSLLVHSQQSFVKVEAACRLQCCDGVTQPTEQRLRNAALGTCSDLAGLVGILRIARPNVLILCPEGETSRAIDDILPHLATPIATCEAEMPFRTLVVEDVDRLTTLQQQRLLHLITDEPDRIQVIATSRHDVIESVESGALLDILYRQLNVVLLDLRAVGASYDAGQSRAGSSLATT
jgi:sigma-54-interacting transcriptional regulator